MISVRGLRNANRTGRTKMKIDTGKKPIETYAWLCADQQCDKMLCYKSSWDSQTVCKLWGATELSSFHDAGLADATKKINSIFSRIERGNKDKKKLSFIKFQNRLLLIWAAYGVVGPYDDHKTIVKALKLSSR
jgi:hypothetical protein